LDFDLGLVRVITSTSTPIENVKKTLFQRNSSEQEELVKLNNSLNTQGQQETD